MNVKIKKTVALILSAGLAVSSFGAIASENNELSLEKVNSYETGTPNPDGGVMEIIAYNQVNQFAYAVNGQSGKLAIIPVTADADFTASEFDVQALVEKDGFTYGDMTSVSVSPNGERLAAAIQAKDYKDNGKIALFTCGADGSLTFEKTFDSGVQPDMVLFADNDTILSADEGEPREGYNEGVCDPMGSLTVISIDQDLSDIIDFTEFDVKREELINQGIIIKKDTLPSVDLEPEYITVSDGKAYVTLQEANAVAVLDIAGKTWDGIYSVGFEDYSEVLVDIDKKDEKYEPKTYESLRGIRMPDGIAPFKSGDKTYLVTANEGDSREWGEYLNEDERNFGKGKTSPTGKITAENSNITGKVVFFDSSDYDGLEPDKDYLFGGRSFTVFEASENGLNEIYTSADDFERITAFLIPDNFNCSNDDKTIDDRSGKKGPEPESVTIGEADGKTYAFIALERIGGIMAYDVSDISDIHYAGYINSRDFSEDISGDVAPEGLTYVRADKNPYGKNLLLAACEVSGTVAAYTVGEETSEPEMPIRQITIDGGDVSIYKGSSKTLKVTVLPESAKNCLIEYTSDNEKVASVDEQGKIEGISAGTAVITAKCALSEDKITVTVKKRPSGGGSSSTPTYKVAFNTNGGSDIESKSIKSNSSIGDIKTPEKDGYTFAGWYLDSGFTKEYSSDYKVTGSVTLYAKWEEKTETGFPKNAFVLTVGSNKASVWGESKTNDAAPIIRNKRTMLPARFVAESLGASVLWTEDEPDKVTVTKDGTLIIIQIGSDTAVVNGKTVKLDSPAFIENDRTYTPVRFISENLGAKVSWDEGSENVFIIKDEN